MMYNRPESAQVDTISWSAAIFFFCILLQNWQVVLTMNNEKYLF